VLMRKRDREDRLGAVPASGHRGARPDTGRTDGELVGEVGPEQLQRG
jgi:hypothetical protein